MEAFDFAFTLFGLVLGLAMAEVLGGFARVLKARGAAPGKTGAAAVRTPIRVGWLTPGIAVAVLLGLIGTWILAWNARAGIPITFATLIAGTAVAGVYYIAANLVWPGDLDEWPDLDDWFDAHKRQIGGAITLATLGFGAVDWSINPKAAALPLQLLYLAMPAALMVTRRRWQSGLAIAVMLGVNAAFAVMG
jgi:hypothetical protein